MKYKIGDVVKIVDKWPPGRTAWENPQGLMDEYLGQYVTITRVDSNWYYIKEDCGRWKWFDPGIEGYAPTISVDELLSLIS